MSDERKRIPIDTSYINALGLTTYAFARCEWQVVWCSEKISPGSINKIISQKMTAGSIAKYFNNVVRNMPMSKERGELRILAEDFARLVDERNKIIHGKPCTSMNGEQRLSGESIIEVVDLEQAADSFVICERKLNSIFYGFLQNYVPR